jgi:hypothetical protein
MKRLILAVMVLMVVGCEQKEKPCFSGTPQERWARIERGMERETAILLLGSPERTTHKQSSFDTMIYPYGGSVQIDMVDYSGKKDTVEAWTEPDWDKAPPQPPCPIRYYLIDGTECPKNECPDSVTATAEEPRKTPDPAICSMTETTDICTDGDIFISKGHSGTLHLDGWYGPIVVDGVTLMVEITSDYSTNLDEKPPRKRYDLVKPQPTKTKRR